MGHKNKRHTNTKKKSPNENPATINYPKLSQQQLEIQCLQVYQYLCNKTKLLKQQQLSYCYIISSKWLNDWKQYVGYSNLSEDDNKKHKKVGKKHPGKINMDLFQHKNNITNKYYHIPQSMEQYTYLNTVISEKKQKDDDYIALPKIIWDIFANKYEHVEIQRPKRITKKGSIQYDGELLALDVIFVNYTDKQLIKSIQQQKVQKKNLDGDFPCDKLQFSNQWELSDLSKFLSEYCFHKHQQQNIKIWKGQGFTTVGALQRNIWQGIHSQQSTFKTPCRLLQGTKYDDLEIDDFLRSYYVLVVEIGDSRINMAKIPQKIQGYCEQCVKKKQLTVTCLCEEVFYCSEECRVVDQIWHFNICKQAYDSSDDQYYKKKLVDLQKVPNSSVGITNLGNTCYMNSVLQSLISIDTLTNYFSRNQYQKQIDPKQLQQNKGRLVQKYSKTCKKLIQSKQSLSPWSLKGQIQFFLPPFKGFKQHDANDFLVNFINALNQQLVKQQGKMYHELFENNFIGQFNSLIKCPQCTIQISNDQIFTQITLPIKQKPKRDTTNYVVYQNCNLIMQGKCMIEDSWGEMRKALHLQQSCLLMATRQSQHFVDVPQDQQDIQKTIRKLKRQLIYYPNCNYQDNDIFFSCIPTSEKILYGQRMKSPYGYPSVINVNPKLHNLGSFWIQILKQYTLPQVYGQAIKIRQQYVNQTQIQEKKQQEAQKKSQKTQCTQKDKQNQANQVQIKIQQKFNNKLKQLIKDNKLNVLIIDLKKSRQICHFCKKKCNGCDLPIKFQLSLSQYLQGKILEVSFQILTNQKINIQKVQKNMVDSGETTLKDCMDLFTQPEQLDEENAWYCQACDNMRLAYKQLTIKKLPTILIIHLNRFKTEGDKKVKNSQPVNYQEVQTFFGQKYQLLSAIIHEGSTQGGHYWAICKRNGKYFIFNDSKVSTTEKTCNKNAYILIYRQTK